MPRIFYIEDEDYVVDDLKRYYETHTFEGDWHVDPFLIEDDTVDTKEIVKKASESNADVVVLDLQFGDREWAGMDLIEPLHQDEPLRPIIVCTVHQPPDDNLEKCYKKGAWDYQPKIIKEVEEVEESEPSAFLSELAHRIYGADQNRHRQKSLQASELLSEDRILDTVSKAVSDALRGPVLDNFSGFVVARFTDENGNSLLSEGEEIPKAKVGQPCKLIVSLHKRKQDEKYEERISILEGNDDAKTVRFLIAWDCDSLEAAEERVQISISPTQDAPETKEFHFTPTKPKKEHTVFVQVFQKNRFIQAVRAKLEVR